MARSNNTNNSGICKPIRKLLNDKHLTVLGLSRCVGRSNVSLHKYLSNPFLMTIGQCIQVSGYLGISDVELYYLMRYNKKEASKTDKENLTSIIKKVEDANKE